MAAYSHIISLKDLEFNNSLAGSGPKDFVLSNSFAGKFWLSPRKDLGTIIRTRRVPILTNIKIFPFFENVSK